MVEMNETVFEEQSCIQVNNDQLSLWVTKDIGPRILGLSFLAGENMLVVLPDAKIPVEGAEDYSLRGGHRLWYAPEDPKTTYIADDQPVEVTFTGNSLRATQPVDRLTRIQKSWQIILDEEEALLTINHNLTNLGEEQFELAPWAVTMLRPGGIGIIPMQTDFDDEHGLHPNRQVVIWPYTEIKSLYLEIKDQAISVKANMSEGALKIGAPNPRGWLAYGLEGNLFVKKTVYERSAKYLDRGASSQIYCNPDVIELETLGPVVILTPGDSVVHQETWQIYPDGKWPLEIKELFSLFE